MGTIRMEKINFSIIVLIAKKEGECGVKDYRPIALLNCVMRIISKMLANRLKVLLPRIVDEAQT